MKIRYTRSSTLAVAALMAILLAGAGLPPVAQAQSPNSQAHLEGTWLVQVTLRVCGTGAPLGTVQSLVTFGHGGTLTESVGVGGFEPGQRTEGHGVWRHTGGRSYSQRFAVLIRFDSAPNPPVSPGFRAGGQVVTHTIELLDRDTFTSSGKNEFFDVNGTLYRSGCSTAAGRRFE